MTDTIDPSATIELAASPLITEVDQTTGPGLPALMTYMEDTAVALADPYVLDAPVDEDLVHLVHVLREGHNVRETVIDRERYLPAPLRKTGNVQLIDVDSLIAYTNRHRKDASVCYLKPGANGASSVFGVILDDHTPDRFSESTSAGWRSHRVFATLKATREWTRWAQADGKMLPQAEFAELIDVGMAQIVSPPAADVLEMAQTLQGGLSVSWRNSHRLDNGETQIAWVEELEGKAGKDGKLTIPSHITLRLAPWQGGPTVELIGRFRWRKSGTVLSMGVLFDDVEGVLEEALRVEAEKFTAATRVPVLWAAEVPAEIKGTRD
jgi:uncharacterized protein YfdQ (DUF2303 family)